MNEERICQRPCSQPAPHATPSVMNTVVNGVGAYATSDLLQPHPTKRGYYRILGRVDDQIMHNTGEKVRYFLLSKYSYVDSLQQTNPGPLGMVIQRYSGSGLMISQKTC